MATKKIEENIEIEATVPASKRDTKAPDYEKLYAEKVVETNALNVKVAELEKLCKSFAEREQKANAALNRATMEYNARTQHMLDCAKHALISMQFAVAASDKNGGNK